MQPNGYAPQYAPQYPTAPQGYPAQPVYPQYPTAPQGYPQQYAAPAPAPAPAAPVVAGSLDSYYAQPSTGGGKAWSFHNRPNGTTYVGVVARPITDADIQQQTDMTTGVPRTYKNGQPMFVMIVPLMVAPSPEFPDGVASWWVRGQARDELVRAMAEAGAPVGPPEAGAMVQVTKVSERAGRPGFNPTYQYRVVYTRPAGVGHAPMGVDHPAYAQPAEAAYVPQPQAQQPYAAPQQLAPAPGYAAPQQATQYPGAMQPNPAAVAGLSMPVPATFPQHIDAQGQGHYAAPVQQAPVQQAPVQQPSPVAAAPGLGGLTADQQQLMARLTGAAQ